MTDHPILFSAPLVRALLERRKTQTRRKAWRFADWEPGEQIFEPGGGSHTTELPPAPKPTVWQKVRPGDRLWVREAFAYVNAIGSPANPQDSPKTLLYRATNTGAGIYQWRPSIHMPRWASRLTLIVTDARVEKLQDITDEDIGREGLETFGGGERGDDGVWHRLYHPVDPEHDNEGWLAPQAFAHSWDYLHGPGSWDANPEVCVITFTVHQANIDNLETAA